MNNKTNHKSLVPINKINIFDKIKKFFKSIFYKQNRNQETIQISDNLLEDNQKEKFNKYITNIENEETKLLKLQKQYEDGVVQEKDLSQQQISDLCELYDRQIEFFKKSNEVKKQKIMQYLKQL